MRVLSKVGPGAGGLVLGGALAGLAAVACGPSFQAIYEGNARFEHCYALEENPQVGMQAKAACWRDWSDHYTYGQTRDRIQYAIARYVALSQAPNIPTDEALMMAAPGMTPRVSSISAPAPTNAFAPPPKVLSDAVDAGAPPKPGRLPEAAPEDAGPPAAPVPRPPGAPCLEDCEGAFRACEQACDRDAGCKCDKAYRDCAKRCLK